MKQKFSAEITENCAVALGVGLPISMKQSIMICNAIRGLSLSKAKLILQGAIDMKRPIPFTRFVNGLGHKPGIGSGRYSIKACNHVLMILKSAEANAQYRGLSTGNLVVKHIGAQQGPGVMRQGRSYHQAKRTHIEVVLEEVEE